MAGRGAWIVLAIGVAVFAVGTVVREPGVPSTFFDLVPYEAVYLAAAVLCWLSRALERAQRSAWRLVALPPGATVVGDVWFTLVLSPRGDVPYPSLSDASYLASYLPLGARVVVMTRARVARLRASMWLDGVVAGLGVAGLALALAGPSRLTSAGDDRLTVAVNLAYPLIDVALGVGVLASLAIVGLRRDGALVAMGGALALYVVADLTYLVGAAGGGYVVGGPLDLTWLVAVTVLPTGARRRAAGALRRAEAGSLGAAAAGPRRLQGGQRLPRPPHRRRAAPGGRWAALPAGDGRAHAGPPRR